MFRKDKIYWKQKLHDIAHRRKNWNMMKQLVSLVTYLLWLLLSLLLLFYYHIVRYYCFR